MKAIRFLLIVVPLSIYVSLAGAAQPIIPNNQVGQTFQFSKGNCSPNINNDTGNIIFICVNGGEKLEDILSNLPEIKKYNQQADEIQELKKKVAELNNKVAKEKADATINLKATNSNFLKISDALKIMRDTYLDLLSNQEGLADKVVEAMLGQIEIHPAPLGTDEEIKSKLIKRLNAISNENLTRIDEKIDTIELRILSLELRVDRIQSDISLLMDSYYGGKLQDTVDFIGISLGTAGPKTKWAPWAGVEYEWLAPNVPVIDRQASVYFEASYLDWVQREYYATLPGLPAQEVVNDNSHLFVSMGARVGMPIGTSSAAYVGAAVGYSITGEPNTGSISLSAGAEYFRKSARVAVEARLEWLSKVAHTDVNFNPFGNAEVSTSNSGETLLLLSTRISFR